MELLLPLIDAEEEEEEENAAERYEVKRIATQFSLFSTPVRVPKLNEFLSYATKSLVFVTLNLFLVLLHSMLEMRSSGYKNI